MRNEIKHGHAVNGVYTPEYGAWMYMNQRCRPNYKRAKDYYARGISVCAEWRTDFAAFFAHMGQRPSPRHQLDRIDNDRGYEPGNVRWALPAENMRNTRRNLNITINGETKCAVDWALQAGLSPRAVATRYKRGWREDALLTPVVNGKTHWPTGMRRSSKPQTPEHLAKRSAGIAKTHKRKQVDRLISDLAEALWAAETRYG